MPPTTSPCRLLSCDSALDVHAKIMKARMQESMLTGEVIGDGPSCPTGIAEHTIYGRIVYQGNMTEASYPNPKLSPVGNPNKMLAKRKLKRVELDNDKTSARSGAQWGEDCGSLVLGRGVWIEGKGGRVAEMRPVSRGSPLRRFYARSLVVRWCVALLVICFLAPFVLHSFSTSCLPPRSYSISPVLESATCQQLFPPVSLDNDSFCTGECKSECFPRVQDICFSSNKIKLCRGRIGRPTMPRNGKLGGHGGLPSSENPLLPNFMRFHGERLTVRLEYAECDEGWHWIDGLATVADQRFLPFKKPNPHHEAEKLIPAVLLERTFGSKLHWFSTLDEVSEWGKGFVSALGMAKKIRYQTLPSREDDSICFHDAILLSAPTTLRYVPDQSTNQWLRTQVLDHCNLPQENTSWPVSKVVILDRLEGPRRLGNKLEIGDLVSRILDVPVDYNLSGLGSFCEQVAPVTRADLFIVPHGSQNAVMLFARPGAIVIEVFPYLFYNTALRNFTHAAAIHVYSVLGNLPPRDWKLWFFSLFGWDFCYDYFRVCKNYARRQPIYADLLELEKVLGVIQRANGSFA